MTGGAAAGAGMWFVIFVFPRGFRPRMTGALRLRWSPLRAIVGNTVARFDAFCHRGPQCLGTAEVVKIVGMAGSRVKGPVIGPMVFAENSRLQHRAGLHWLN
jgi:hypothetical protein